MFENWQGINPIVLGQKKMRKHETLANNLMMQHKNVSRD